MQLENNSKGTSHVSSDKNSATYKTGDIQEHFSILKFFQIFI